MHDGKVCLLSFIYVTVEMLGRPEIIPNSGGVFSIHKNIKVEDAFLGGLDRLLTLHVNSYHFSLSHSRTHSLFARLVVPTELNFTPLSHSLTHSLTPLRGRRDAAAGGNGVCDATLHWRSVTHRTPLLEHSLITPSLPH